MAWRGVWGGVAWRGVVWRGVWRGVSCGVAWRGWERARTRIGLRIDRRGVGDVDVVVAPPRLDRVCFLQEVNTLIVDRMSSSGNTVVVDTAVSPRQTVSTWVASASSSANMVLFLLCITACAIYTRDVYTWCVGTVTFSACLTAHLLARGNRVPFYRFRYVFLRVYDWAFKAYDAICCTRRNRATAWFDCPTLVHENRLEDHPPLLLLRSLEDALFAEEPTLADGAQGNGFLFTSASKTMLERLQHLRSHACSDWTASLDGDDWRFHLADRPTLPSEEGHASHRSTPTFAQPDFDDSSWGTVAVPGAWQQAGYGQKVYTNFSYPVLDRYNFKRPIVPYEKNETGLYRKHFCLPRHWRASDRHVVLLLHAAGPACRVFLNGVYIGVTKDSMTCAAFDLSVASDTLRFDEGANVLAIEIVRWSDAHFMEDQDQWWFSGIHRSVELQCRPNVSMQSVRVATELDEPRLLAHAPLPRRALDMKTIDDQGAEVLVHVDFCAKPGRTPRDGHFYTVRTVLYDWNGELVTEHEEECRIEPHGVQSAPTYQTTIRVASPFKWCAERPVLYTLGLELLRTFDRTVVQAEVVRVGFRHVDIVDGTLRVNWNPIVICGANRHEHSASGGKTVSDEETWTDLITMKQNNFNAVRCSHYPNAMSFYDMANELGLYVCDEANIETHGFTQSSTFSLLACLPEWQGMFLRRVQSMAKRTINHPCVILHSLGNESGTGPNLDACSAWLREHDPSRPVQYEGGRNHGDAVLLLGDGQGACSLTDIVCPMYHSAATIEATVADPRERRPLILCEYAHAMGNSNGNLDHYFRLFWSTSPTHRQLQGGFVWDWIDQGLEFSEGLGYGYGGDFGPESGAGDAQFCINGVCLPDRTPKPAIKEFKHLQSRVSFRVLPTSDHPILQVEVRNRHDHLDLDNIEFEWGITGGAGLDFLARGIGYVDNEHTRPGETTHMAIPFDLSVSSGATHLHIWAIDHTPVHWLERDEPFVMAHFSTAVGGRAGDAAPLAEAPENGVECLDGIDLGFGVDTVTIDADAYACSFGKADGALKALQFWSSEENEGESPFPLVGFKHCFYRAPTDNDRGGLDTLGGNIFPPWVLRILETWAPKNNSFSWNWKMAGLHQITSRRMVLVEPEFNEGTRQRTVVEEHYGKSLHALENDGRGEKVFTTTTTWQFLAEGVQIHVRVEPNMAVLGKIKTLCSLPRVGVELKFPNAYNKVVWEGLGPHECYNDRQASAWYGVHCKDVDDMHTPYVVPSENGARVGVRAVTFVDESATGEYNAMTIEVENRNHPNKRRNKSYDGAVLSVSRYSVEELDHASHDDELGMLPERPYFYVHLDAAMMGLGGDNSWEPVTLPEYFVPVDQVWEYDLTIYPATVSVETTAS